MAKNEDKNDPVKKQLTNGLDRILSHIVFFLRKCKSSNLTEEELSDLIYNHSIYKNRDKINSFSEKINNSGEFIENKIIELQEESVMRKKKRSEIDNLKNILNTTIKNLPQEEQRRLLLKSEEKEDISEKNEDEILIEDTKDVEKRNLLQKKRKKEKGKQKEEKQKEKYIFRTCYICKQKLGIDNINKFYGALCKKCGDYNYSFRTMELDFKSRIAVVTGGRVKIGYYIVTKLLSYGCKVITTTRFPNDALIKFKEDPDYDIWKNNLIIYPIDFRIFQSTVKFVNYLKDNFTHIDFLINNAAQTVRRNTEYYEYLLPIELKKLKKEDDKKIIKNDYLELKKNVSEDLIREKSESLSEEQKNELTKNYEQKEILNSLAALIKNKDPNKEEILPLSVIASQIKIMEENEQSKIYIMGADGQPYDFSKGKNSWNLELDEISFQEFTEVQIINAWTPFYLCAKLKPLMNKSPFKDKYIVNVTAVEGIFNHYKRTTHVHTNMAKAALNMLTRTCGKYLQKEEIYMTCVDTGWVSHMNEMTKILDEENQEYAENEMANVPLDELDGAMRVLHPIIEGIKNKNYLYGILLKDYAKSNW